MMLVTLDEMRKLARMLAMSAPTHRPQAPQVLQLLAHMSANTPMMRAPVARITPVPAARKGIAGEIKP